MSSERENNVGKNGPPIPKSETPVPRSSSAPSDASFFQQRLEARLKRSGIEPLSTKSVKEHESEVRMWIGFGLTRLRGFGFSKDGAKEVGFYFWEEPADEHSPSQAPLVRTRRLGQMDEGLVDFAEVASLLSESKPADSLFKEDESIILVEFRANGTYRAAVCPLTTTPQSDTSCSRFAALINKFETKWREAAPNGK